MTGACGVRSAALLAEDGIHPPRDPLVAGRLRATRSGTFAGLPWPLAIFRWTAPHSAATIGALPLQLQGCLLMGWAMICRPSLEYDGHRSITVRNRRRAPATHRLGIRNRLADYAHQLGRPGDEIHGGRDPPFGRRDGRKSGVDHGRPIASGQRKTAQPRGFTGGPSWIRTMDLMLIKKEPYIRQSLPNQWF